MRLACLQQPHNYCISVARCGSLPHFYYSIMYLDFKDRAGSEFRERTKKTEKRKTFGAIWMWSTYERTKCDKQLPVSDIGYTVYGMQHNSTAPRTTVGIGK